MEHINWQEHHGNAPGSPERPTLTAMDKLPTVADVDCNVFTRTKHGHTLADRNTSMLIANKMNSDDKRDAAAIASILRDTQDPSVVSGESHDRRAFLGL